MLYNSLCKVRGLEPEQRFLFQQRPTQLCLVSVSRSMYMMQQGQHVAQALSMHCTFRCGGWPTPPLGVVSCWGGGPWCMSAS